MKNFLILQPRFSFFRPWKEGICYLDYFDENSYPYRYSGNPLLEKISSFKYDKEMARNDDYINYDIIFGTYHKRDREKILEAMDILDKKLTIKRGKEYLDILDELKGFFNLDQEERNARPC